MSLLLYGSTSFSHCHHIISFPSAFPPILTGVIDPAEWTSHLDSLNSSLARHSALCCASSYNSCLSYIFSPFLCFFSCFSCNSQSFQRSEQEIIRIWVMKMNEIYNQRLMNDDGTISAQHSDSSLIEISSDRMEFQFYPINSLSGRYSRRRAYDIHILVPSLLAAYQSKSRRRNSTSVRRPSLPTLVCPLPLSPTAPFGLNAQAAIQAHCHESILIQQQGRQIVTSTVKTNRLQNIDSAAVVGRIMELVEEFHKQQRLKQQIDSPTELSPDSALIHSKPPHQFFTD
jgi:hypothetical protein